jgi:serine protease Do
LTTAGTLPADPRCRLLDGQVLAASVVGINPAFDLALLNVQRATLPSVRWAKDASPAAGTILSSVGTSEVPPAIGVVSVRRRNLPGPFPVRVSRRDARRPGVLGKPSAAGYLVESVQLGEAHEAGIRSGDVILTMAGRDIRNDENLLDCVRGRTDGERVPVVLMRGGQRHDLTLSLVVQPKPFVGFPTFFECDMTLAPGQCGGPVVNLAGEVVGIAVYRGPYGCMVIPGDCVESLLPELKSGGRADERIKP